MAIRLTKTKYLSAQQCLKRVWYEIRRPDMVAPPTQSQKRIMDQGTEVGELARLRFPGGLLISSFGKRSLQETKQAIEQGATVLFEPALQYDGILVRCDVLKIRDDGTWDIIEVKSSTSVKHYHLDDLAVQRYVVQGSGLQVGGLKLMHLNNKDCVYPDLRRLFVIEDVTEQVAAATKELKPNLKVIHATLRRKKEPELPIGWHCDHPFDCPMKYLCWRDVPRVSIFTIPRLSANKISDLLSRGILRVKDVPADYPLSDGQRAYVDMVQRGEPEIIPGGVRAMLSDLERPIHFLDFETIAYAVPRFEGMRPYQGAPFQYSCHVLHRNGRLGHREYLHMDSSDPRPALVHHLLQDIESSGSVVVYSAGFEGRVLRELAQAVPGAAKGLKSIMTRMWDQRLVFQRFYVDPGFLGSTSIKNVLPVVVPGLSYSDLAIQRGDAAQTAWLQMIAVQDEDEKQRLAADLRDYCQLDTYAMVEIHRALEAVAKS